VPAYIGPAEIVGNDEKDVGALLGEDMELCGRGEEEHEQGEAWKGGHGGVRGDV